MSDQNDFSGSVTGTSGGSGNNGPSGSDNNGGAGTGGSSGGGASIDVGSLGISGQMSFTAGDMLAISGFAVSGASAAISVSYGNPYAAVATIMGALIADQAAGDPLAHALNDLVHDVGLGLMQVAAQQGSAITGSPVSVLGLYGSGATFDTASGILDTGPTGAGYDVTFAMYGGAAVSLYQPNPYQNPASGLESGG